MQENYISYLFFFLSSCVDTFNSIFRAKHGGRTKSWEFVTKIRVLHQWLKKIQQILINKYASVQIQIYTRQTYLCFVNYKIIVLKSVDIALALVNVLDFVKSEVKQAKSNKYCIPFYFLNHSSFQSRPTLPDKRRLFPISIRATFLI